jgi:hypothetical protein
VTNRRLEDFGVEKTTTAEQRLSEYRKQKLTARQWIATIDKDPEVGKLVTFARRRKVKS